MLEDHVFIIFIVCSYYTHFTFATIYEEKCENLNVVVDLISNSLARFI